MERIFVNSEGEMQIFGPLGDLLFEVEDVNLLSGNQLAMLGRMIPEEGEAPVRIDSDNIVEWRKKFAAMQQKQKEAIWDN